MPMIKKRCSECGETRWHNPQSKKQGESESYRCTGCGHPLGTGPKRDKNMGEHLKQVAKARAAAAKGL